ncbi:hypothetical protein PT974_04955 [Cladobotryum mycophilum]|uniref:Nudix hydrolase domain-containing protein n=1 Tax=Cladobotryum mycophilum TaxID=491253 RepID=A0ABR0SQM6_9HYPO
MAQPNGTEAISFDFTFDESLTDLTVSKDEWLRINEKSFDGMASAAVIFDSQDRVLLIQRAAHDSMPNKWEVPGGAVDPEDISILHGCARETVEEAGLKAKHFKRLINEGEGKEKWSVFTNSRGTKIISSFAFEVEVEEGVEVKLDPNEHQDWTWVGEEEVKAGVTRDGKRIPLSASMVQNRLSEAFRLRRQDKEKKQ